MFHVFLFLSNEWKYRTLVIDSLLVESDFNERCVTIVFYGLCITLTFRR